VSDFVLNIISTDPAWMPPGDLADRALLVLRRLVPAATEVKAELFDGIHFADQGSNFESVFCSHCGGLLDQVWWSEQMDAAWSPETSRFTDCM
jgi:hypothetical protein